MAGILNIASGLQDWRDEDYKRKQQEQVGELRKRSLDETIRSNQADEGLRGQQMTEMSALRKVQEQGRLDTQAENQQIRRENITRQMIPLQKRGAKLTEQDLTQQMAAGAPSNLYKVGEWQGGIVPPEMGEGPDRTRDISFEGTQAQADAEDRIAQSQRNSDETNRYHNLQNENTDLSRSLARERENRISGWGPPTIIIGDPNNPGSSRVVPRNTANQPGGVAAPVPAGMQTQAINNDVSTEQLDRLENMFQQGAKDLVGPAEGRLRSIGQQIPGLPTNEKFANFQAETAAFRNSVIKAITGAQMSEREADRIRQQIPEVSDKPEVWTAKARQTRQNLQDLGRVVSQRQGGSQTPAPAAAGGGQRKVGRFIVEE